MYLSNSLNAFIRTIQKNYFVDFGYFCILYCFIQYWWHLSRNGYIIFMAHWKPKCKDLCSKSKNLRWKQQNFKTNMVAFSAQDCNCSAHTPMKSSLYSWDRQVTCLVLVYMERDWIFTGSLMAIYERNSNILSFSRSKIALEGQWISIFAPKGDK